MNFKTTVHMIPTNSLNYSINSASKLNMLKMLIRIVFHVRVPCSWLNETYILIPIIVNILVTASHISVDVHVLVLLLTSVNCTYSFLALNIYVLSRGKCDNLLQIFNKIWRISYIKFSSKWWFAVFHYYCCLDNFIILISSYTDVHRKHMVWNARTSLRFVY